MDKKIGSGLLNSDKEKFIKTPNLRISGHLLQWEDVVIQTSNITLISTAKVQPPSFPIWAAVVAYLGFSLMFVVWYIGVILLMAGAFAIYLWYQDRQKKKDLRVLSIQLNSGRTFSLIFQEEAFLQEVMKVFVNLFEDGGAMGNTSITVDIAHCTIDNQSSVIGSVTGR